MPHLMLLLGSLLVSARASAAESREPRPVAVFDTQPLRRLDLRQPDQARGAWDTLHLLAALQGLVNRDGPELYLLHAAEFGVETDRFWLDWYRGEDGWLRDRAPESVPDLDTLLARFRNRFDGVVLYDERVPATAALASTAAGVERLLPIRRDPAPDSLHSRLVGRLGLPVKLALVHPDGSPFFAGTGTVPDLNTPSSGSAKADAYRWAMKRWLQPGGCTPGVAAYYLDAYWLRRPTGAGHDMHTLANHDWFIARRAFFFDLSPWGDEPPVDEPAQPVGTDKRVLLEVLRNLADLHAGSIVKIGGFPPWPFKYTTHAGAGRHEPVPTEWEFTRLISQFNAYHEADAAGLGAMANASFHTHYPLRARYPQPNPRPTAEQWKQRGFLGADGRVANRFFVGHYVGDYDAPSWLYKAVPRFFRDPARGQVPLGWAFDPNLADRAPQALAYAYAHATTNDFFIAGDSGAGYLNPRALTVRPDSGLPPALEAWVHYCRPRYERWGMTMTGFVLDGSAGASTDAEFAAYRTFSPDGCGTHHERHPAMHAGVPTCPERDLPDDAAAAAAEIARRAKASAGKPGFLWARSILKSPSWYADVSRHLRAKHGDLPVEIVDPYTFFGLIAQANTANAANSAAPSAPLTTAPPPTISLVRDGKPVTTIVTAATPTPAARLAALEIQTHVLKITGVELPIRGDAEPVEGPRLLVGDSAATRALGLTPDDLGAQEYRIVFRPDAVVLLGRDWQDTPANRRESGRTLGDQRLSELRHRIDYWKTVELPNRGTLDLELPGLHDDQGTCLAAYDFLERFCDVRWYGPTDLTTTFPRRSDLTVSGPDVRRSPALKHRNAFVSASWPFLRGQWGEFSTPQVQLMWRRWRLGGEKWAGNHTIHRRTIETTLNDPEYQATGPAKGLNLCYTHPKLVAAVAAMARDYFDGRGELPEGFKALGTYFTVVPEDTAKYCACDRCRAILDRNKDRKTGHFSSGEISDYWFSFVNAVAREVAKTHPDRYIATLAYWNYAFPPREFDLEPNVSIAPCLHTCAYSINPAMRDNDLLLYRGWLARNRAPMFLWNYYHHPTEPALIDRWKCFPNVMVHETARAARGFIRDGVRGIFECGEQDQVEQYILARIWDDPSLDTDGLLDEFFGRYFGAAAAPMNRFYRRLEAIAGDASLYPPEKPAQSRVVAWKNLGTAERMAELGALVADAERLASTETERRRVALWRGSLWQWMLDGRAQFEAGK